MKTDLIDYAKCNEYARVLCGTYGIPECDWGDIGSDAYLLSIRRSWRTESGGNEQAVANRLMYTSVLNVINRRNRHSIRILSDAEGLYKGNDDNAPSDDEVVEERFAANDRGSTEEYLADYLDWQNPFWLRLFQNERRKLKNPHRRLVNLLMKDCRLPLARAEMEVSRPTFLTYVGKLREHFDLCFQALRAWRGEK